MSTFGQYIAHQAARLADLRPTHPHDRAAWDAYLDAVETGIGATFPPVDVEQEDAA
jgi:hypothetical protein